MKEETEEIEESQAEMEPDSQDPQDPPDLQDRSSTKTASTTLLAAPDLREDLEFLARLDSLAQLDPKATVESLVCPDTVQRGRKASRVWWSDLTGASSDWRDSADRRETEDLWDPSGLLVRMVLRGSKERSGCPGARVVPE